MAHERVRWMSVWIEKLLKFSPIIGVLGQRQTGKTTLITKISKEYRTLDLKSELLLASTDPLHYLEKRASPFAIDECQMSPELFPALKEKVRVFKKPGQFIISGSVRFTSRKQIKESLTGRVALVELLPFSIAELYEKECPDLNLIKNIEKKNEKAVEYRIDQWKKFQETGGLPGICFRRDKRLIYQGFEDQLSTLLDRDIGFILDTKLSYATLLNILKQVGLQVGSKLNLEEISQLSRVSKPTLRKVLHAFESMFLIRFLEKKGGVKTKTVFFEDVGLLKHLVGHELKQDYIELNALYQCLRLPYYCRAEEKFEFFQYHTRGGAYAPLCISYAGKNIAIIITPNSESGSSEIKTAQSFLKNFKNSKVIIIGHKMKFHQLTQDMMTAPFLSLL